MSITDLNNLNDGFYSTTFYPADLMHEYITYFAGLKTVTNATKLPLLIPQFLCTSATPEQLFHKYRTRKFHIIDCTAFELFTEINEFIVCGRKRDAHVLWLQNEPYIRSLPKYKIIPMMHIIQRSPSMYHNLYSLM